MFYTSAGTHLCYSTSLLFYTSVVINPCRSTPLMSYASAAMRFQCTPPLLFYTSAIIHLCRSTSLFLHTSVFVYPSAAPSLPMPKMSEMRNPRRRRLGARLVQAESTKSAELPHGVLPPCKAIYSHSESEQFSESLHSSSSELKSELSSFLLSFLLSFLSSFLSFFPSFLNLLFFLSVEEASSSEKSPLPAKAFLTLLCKAGSNK